MVEPREQAQRLESTKAELEGLESDTFPPVRVAVEELADLIESLSSNPSSERTLTEARNVALDTLADTAPGSERSLRELNVAAEELVGPAESMSRWADTGPLAETLGEIFHNYEEIYSLFSYVGSRHHSPVGDEFLAEAENRVERAKQSLDKLENELFETARSQYPTEESLAQDVNRAQSQYEDEMARRSRPDRR